MFTERLKENAPWITIDYRGGPEVMAPNLIIEGVASGAFDGAHLPGDYYVEQLPAMEIARFSPFTPTEEREQGIHDLYVDIHEEALGVHYVGHTNSGMPQLLMLRDKKITTPDLSGLSIRTSSATSEHGLRAGRDAGGDARRRDLHRAREGRRRRHRMASVGPSSFGFHEQVAYDIAPRFYESLGNTVINGDTWAGLDAETQDAIESTMKEIEPEIFDYYQQASREETRTWRDAGVELIEFTGADAEKMLTIAYDDAWDALDWDAIVTANPQAEEIRSIFEEEYGEDYSNAVPGGTVIEPADQ